ncbi:MAG: hypothetical protein DUD27_07555 [Lachnospiraceae bacterium]|uniref:Uncharacterized protein n=1 Tax=Candidatus Weimeria bifida TaxID=2599074 RepID=A0A6N7IY88_9FIRM|nr:hypothetical protein [Candidatus Weimeria bifida]RRF95693.1 MAG: hypothetical protein DUD27_07555 [Lachnospiraceae bacterium]
MAGSTDPYIASHGNAVKRNSTSTYPYLPTKEGEYFSDCNIIQEIDDLPKRSSSFRGYTPNPPGLKSSGLSKVVLTTVTQPKNAVKTHDPNTLCYHSTTLFESSSPSSDTTYTVDHDGKQDRVSRDYTLVCYYIDAWDRAGNHTKKLILTPMCRALLLRRIISGSSYD